MISRRALGMAVAIGAVVVAWGTILLVGEPSPGGPSVGALATIVALLVASAGAVLYIAKRSSSNLGPVIVALAAGSLLAVVVLSVFAMQQR